MGMKTIEFKPVRHSSLPKLAECPCYESAPGEAGPAAQRGLLLDAVYRARLGGVGEAMSLEAAMPRELSVEDAAAVDWAVTMTLELGAGARILSDEARCKVRTPGMEHVGTADAIIPERRMVVDLKSGQVRNYREQMAAYALGMMNESFESEWTCVLLFCDAKKTVEHQFTWEEAENIVSEVVKGAMDPERKPSLCEYCDWCAKSGTCEARVEAVEQTRETMEIVAPLTVDQREWVLESLLEDREATGRFLAQAKVFDAFREKVEERVKAFLENDPESVPGWRLRAGGTSEVVFADDLARLVESGTISWDGVLGTLGNMSGKKFRELWTKEMATQQMPDVIRQGPERKPSLVAASRGRSGPQGRSKRSRV